MSEKDRFLFGLPIICEVSLMSEKDRFFFLGLPIMCPLTRNMQV